MTEQQSLLESPRFRSAKKELLQAIVESSEKIRAVRPPSSSAAVKETYLKTIQEFVRDRGRDLIYPYLSSGTGSGPYVELVDGSVKMDLITGIGINFFGHAHPALMEEMIDALPADLMQGNLQPGHEAQELLSALLSKVRGNSNLRQGWITTCGTMANENALKMIRQKHAPATKILAFKDCFSGRSTAMQEITDNPGYRQGQPIYGEVHYLTFYQPNAGLEASVQKTLTEMRDALSRYPGKFCGLMMEPVQGEGGFNAAPREYYVKVFEEAKKAGLAIWLDEIQTFGRTGELFAFQKYDLGEFVDVVTAAKMLQTAVVLYTENYNPKPGLVSGTFCGSTAAIRVARKTLELLTEGEFFGPDGKIEKLSARFVSRLNALKEGSCKGKIREIRAVGGMIALSPFDGKLTEVKAVLAKLFELGAVAFYCGHDPYLVRLLPPLGVMTEKDVDTACELVENAILRVE